MNNLYVKAVSYDQNPELIRRYMDGDDRAGERLIDMNMPLVYSIASRFRERCEDVSDLVECGTLGLVKAIKTCDVSREEKRICVLINKEREKRQNRGEKRTFYR